MKQLGDEIEVVCVVRTQNEKCVTIFHLRAVSACACDGERMTWREKMNPKTQAIFLEGLRRYRERGVRILLDGKEVEVEDLRIIFEEQTDGSFYMGDYVLEEDPLQREPLGTPLKVQETQVEYAKGKNGKCRKELKEIRFDKVYNR